MPLRMRVENNPRTPLRPEKPQKKEKPKSIPSVKETAERKKEKTPVPVTEKKAYGKRTIWIGVRPENIICKADNVAKFKEAIDGLKNKEEIVAIQGRIAERQQKATYK